MLLFPWTPRAEAGSPFPETLTYFATGVDGASGLVSCVLELGWI